MKKITTAKVIDFSKISKKEIEISHTLAMAEKLGYPCSNEKKLRTFSMGELRRVANTLGELVHERENEEVAALFIDPISEVEEEEEGENTLFDDPEKAEEVDEGLEEVEEEETEEEEEPCTSIVRDSIYDCVKVETVSGPKEMLLQVGLSFIATRFTSEGKERLMIWYQDEKWYTEEAEINVFTVFSDSGKRQVKVTNCSAYEDAIKVNPMDKKELERRKERCYEEITKEGYRQANYSEEKAFDDLGYKKPRKKNKATIGRVMGDVIKYNLKETEIICKAYSYKEGPKGRKYELLDSFHPVVVDISSLIDCLDKDGVIQKISKGYEALGLNLTKEAMFVISGPGVEFLTESREVNGFNFFDKGVEPYDESLGLYLYLPKDKSPTAYSVLNSIYQDGILCGTTDSDLAGSARGMWADWVSTGEEMRKVMNAERRRIPDVKKVNGQSGKDTAYRLADELATKIVNASSEAEAEAIELVAKKHIADKLKEVGLFYKVYPKGFLIVMKAKFKKARMQNPKLNNHEDAYAKVMGKINKMKDDTARSRALRNKGARSLMGITKLDIQLTIDELQIKGGGASKTLFAALCAAAE